MPESRSRREFLKNTVIASGAVWAAPAIATVGSRAVAASPAPCSCSGSAVGLFSTGEVNIAPTGSSANAPPNNCEATISNVLIGLTAQTLCGEFDPATCRASASVQRIQLGSVGPVGVLDARAVTSTASQGCDCRSTGTTSIASLTYNGNAVAVSGACNTTINLSPFLSVTVNEQRCGPDGSLTVSALHILLVNPLTSGVTNIFVAQSTAHANGCTGCQTCSG